MYGRFRSIFGRESQPEHVTIATAAGDLRLDKHEAKMYGYLWEVVDTDDDGHVGGGEGALFLRRSGLTNDELRELWRLACGGASKPSLERDDFLVACKLVASVQAGNPCTLEALLEKQDGLALAEFGWGAGVDTSRDAVPEVPDTAISVSISNPHSVGSGLNRHTEYTVTLSTSLDHFPVKDASVNRRYSDFHWLHERLCRRLPSVILPLFPEKKTLGRMDTAFVQQRMAALEAHLERLVHHPRVVRCFDLVVFLTASERGMEAAKRFVEALEEDAEESDSMISQLVHGAGQKLVIKADEDFVSLCAFHSAALARLEQTSRVNDQLSQAGHAATDHMVELGNACLAIAEAEKRGESAGAGVEAARRADEKAAEAVRGLAGSASGGGGGGGGEEGGEGGGAIVSRDAEAREAFLAHMQVRASAEDRDEMEAMFQADFDDPLSNAHHHQPPASAAAEGSKKEAAPGSPEAISSLTGLFRTVGAETCRVGHMRHDHLDRLESTLYEPMRNEQVREAEIEQATERRERAVQAAQAAHALLQRRRKNYQQAASGGVADKIARAQSLVDRSERELEQRKEELAFITEEVKREMVRVMQERRAMLARRVHEYVRLHHRQAEVRKEAWESLVDLLAASPEEREAHTRGVRELAATARAGEASAAQQGGGGSGGGDGAAAGAGDE